MADDRLDPGQGSGSSAGAGSPAAPARAVQTGDAPQRGGLLRECLIALQFFTRIPVTGRLADWVGFSPALLRASAAHFPAVGWVVGGLSALVLWVLLQLLQQRHTRKQWPLRLQLCLWAAGCWESTRQVRWKQLLLHTLLRWQTLLRRASIM